MIKALNKYRSDICMLGIVAMIFLAFILLFVGRFGDTMVDCPRELYIPSEIIKGKILYKDIFSLYPPLGYYFNAIVVKIFGSSLNLFYTIGALNTFLCLALIYAISRCFVKQLMSFSIVILALFTCCMSNSMIVNYIFPYSYSFIYALTCFLASFLFFVLYFKANRENKFIFLSFLFAGFSTAFKFEFILSFLPFIFVFYENGKFQFLNLFKSLGLFVSPIILSYLPIVIQSDVQTLSIFFEYLKGFFASESTKDFMNTIYITSPKEFLIANLKNIFFACVYFIPICSIFYFKEKLGDKISKFRHSLIFVLAIYISFYIVKYIWSAKIYVFSYFAILTLIFAVLYFIKLVKSRADENLFFGLFLLSVFLSSTRVYFYLSSNHYGKFILPLFFVCVFGVCLKQVFQGKEEIYEKIMAYSLLIFSCWMLYFASVDLFKAKDYCIISSKGKIYGSYPVAKTVEDTANYIKSNSVQADKVLVLPEGLLINYLSERSSMDLYYQLLPNHIDILGEANIVNGLKQNSPEFVVLTSLKTIAYGKTNICFDYGLKICDYINKNYDIVETFSNTKNSHNFMAIVLKQKK